MNAIRGARSTKQLQQYHRYLAMQSEQSEPPTPHAVHLKRLPLLNNTRRAKVCIIIGLILFTACWVALFLCSLIFGQVAYYFAALLGLAGMSCIAWSLNYL